MHVRDHLQDYLCSTASEAQELQNLSPKENCRWIIQIAVPQAAWHRQWKVWIWRSSPPVNTLCVKKWNIWQCIVHGIIPSLDPIAKMIICEALYVEGILAIYARGKHLYRFTEPSTVSKWRSCLCCIIKHAVQNVDEINLFVVPELHMLEQCKGARDSPHIFSVCSRLDGVNCGHEHQPNCCDKRAAAAHTLSSRRDMCVRPEWIRIPLNCA